jgi:epoxyqueuosine reductase
VRARPGELLPEGKVALIVAVSVNIPRMSDAAIARYARFKDYHKHLRRLGSQLLEKLKSLKPDLKGRVVVDSAPHLERALAVKTSAGFIGKNTLYIHPEYGSHLLLGEIILDQNLEIDAPSPVNPQERTSIGGCGTCRRCQVNCPTDALKQDYKIDAQLCLSYWTIEHRGPIPIKFWPYLGKYYYGCDICQDVCPYNRNVPILPSLPRHYAESLDLREVALMSQKQYEEWFGGSPMTRAKRVGLRRNALIACIVNGIPDTHLLIEKIESDQYEDEVLKKTAEQGKVYLADSKK